MQNPHTDRDTAVLLAGAAHEVTYGRVLGVSRPIDRLSFLESNQPDLLLCGSFWTSSTRC